MRSDTCGIVLAAVTFTVGSACAQTGDVVETRTSGDAAQALVVGDYARAIELANRATALEPSDPWPYYDRASALVALNRTDEAIATFRQAEARFGDDRWGRSIAIWGRARAHQLAGNCAEAAQMFQEYVAFVHDSDSRGAVPASRFARECATRVRTVIGGGPKSR